MPIHYNYSSRALMNITTVNLILAKLFHKIIAKILSIYLLIITLAIVIIITIANNSKEMNRIQDNRDQFSCLKIPIKGELSLSEKIKI